GNRCIVLFEPGNLVCRKREGRWSKPRRKKMSRFYACPESDVKQKEGSYFIHNKETNESKYLWQNKTTFG
ncbi:MAG TPA: hypothetical protein PLG91_14555, partial [Ferruginibacter sp.]|nr:hypothetical protein [Ferruginibacter sp.]